MNRVCVIIFVELLALNVLGQGPKCNQALLYAYLRPKLDSSICIPQGYHILEVHDKIDLNADGVFDKVIRWQRVKLNDGDTTFYSIYVGLKTGGWTLHKELDNLRPLYFKNYDFESKTGNKFFDSIKSNYSYPTLSEVEFLTNTIGLKFYTDAATVKQIYFTYSRREDTWVLTRELQWFAPSRYESENKLEFDRSPEISMKIENFDMLKYIGW